jgi:hypothetical protein
MRASSGRTTALPKSGMHFQSFRHQAPQRNGLPGSSARPKRFWPRMPLPTPEISLITFYGNFPAGFFSLSLFITLPDSKELYMKMLFLSYGNILNGLGKDTLHGFRTN